MNQQPLDALTKNTWEAQQGKVQGPKTVAEGPTCPGGTSDQESLLNYTLSIFSRS